MRRLRHCIFALAFIALVFDAGAACPPAKPIMRVRVSRDNMIVFPITGNRITHRGLLRACVFGVEPTTKESLDPIPDMAFDLVNYTGSYQHEGGPEPADLKFINPAGPLDTIGQPIRLRTTASGELSRSDLPTGQWAMLPDWPYGVDEVWVEWYAVSTIDVNVAVGK